MIIVRFLLFALVESMTDIDFKCPENGFVTTAESHRNLVKSNLSTETLSTKPDLTKDEEKIISEILNSENSHSEINYEHSTFTTFVAIPKARRAFISKPAVNKLSEADKTIINKIVK